MVHLSPNRFRVFLHLARIQSRRADLEVHSGQVPRSEEGLTSVSQGLAGATAARSQEDWLGYEVELFRIAAGAFQALEEHHRKLGVGGHLERPRWGWEALDGSGGGTWPTRAQAVAQAMAELPPGASYRVGRLASVTPGHHLPPVAELLDRMRDLARVAHGLPDLPWPTLERAQREELQGLLEGLFTAFLEGEGHLLTLPTWEDLEVRRVPEVRREVGMA